ncbi:hypothetical protein EJ02DRAFT_513844 [Clathrospora elynae]|uniref:Rhodopsin domain-containing protein n=1 Tax=Clathrospora elynae TaxID=706981 RepID=A0A6A5SLM4_9PLEO|nr:hypothetical protein EJ02DRAFT_513844 [Clathrospora elynae]
MATVVPPNPLPPDESLGGVLLVLTCILVSFTIITTVLRIWARLGRGAMGGDDYAICVCCLLAVARTAIQIVSVQHGNGRHRWYISKADYEYVNFLTWLTQLFLFTNIGLLKCSICLLMLRIKKDRMLRYCLYGMMVGLVLTNLLPIIVLLAECNPPKQYWKPSSKGKCWPTKVRIYSIYLQVAYSVITDLICALLPIAVLWKVKINMRTKLGVCVLMSLGLIATAVAIVRASSLGTKSADLSYDYCIAAIWANTELHVGISATNFALSRMIWAFFTGNQTSEPSGNTPRYGTSSTLSKRKSRQGYVRSQDYSMYDKDGLGNKRQSRDNTSRASQIPLDPMIRKAVSVHMTSVALQGSAGSTESLPNWSSPAQPGGCDDLRTPHAI